MLSNFRDHVSCARLLALAAVACASLSSMGSEAPTQAPWSKKTDAAFLNEIEHRAVLYFMEQSDPVSGLTHDRAPADGGAMSKAPASIAATGFALTGWCIADSRGWSRPGEALARVRTVLKFVAEHAAQEHGWIHHFLDPSTGARAWNSEASTIDTALFLSGAISARQYFKDPEVTRLVDEIYGRVDWKWALNGGETLTHGWRPETGFINSRWDRYAEMMGLYLLGLGAPVPDTRLRPVSWNAWRRGPVLNFKGRRFINSGPLFTHQFAHAWFDFRGLKDAHADYWVNSVQATLAQHDWFVEHSRLFDGRSSDLWGLTASDSERGYIAWGGPGGIGSNLIDGTVVPCAPGGSLPFAPEECLSALRAMRKIGGHDVWRRYGFVDAFNPETGWTSDDVIGIDLGITLLMTENYRTGFVWKVFMGAPEVRLAMRLAGFRSNPSDTQVELAAR